ncbi:MAG: HlyD family efflux transporter periplasmic adaptor subunit [Coriobacteriia bacterium]|nr:HlyD family efflux transporter periplasmic adaptor subunit [Coriobacteriia bacterium]
MSAEAAPTTAARKRKSRWAIAGVCTVAVVAAGAIGAYFLLNKGTSATSISTGTATTRTVTSTISGTGSLVVSKSVVVTPVISGKVEELYVSLGDTVAVGQKLYKISDEDAQATLLTANTALLQAKQQLIQAQSSYRQATNSVYSAQTQVIQAQQSLDKLVAGGGSADQITIAQRNVTSAESGVTNAQAQVSSASLQVDTNQAAVSKAQATYDTALANSQNTVVTAPMAGMITSLPFTVGSTVSAGTSSSSSTGASSAGATTGTSSSSSSSSTGLTISDLNSLRVSISVSEVNVTSLVLGQKASISIDALANKTFTGTVVSISPNGTSSSGVVTFAVQLALDPQDSRLRPSMTATADIKIATVENVVAVPSVAIHTSGTTKYVLVYNNGASTETSVTTGLSDDTYTEVKSGLSAGAVVVTGSTSTGTSTTTSNSASSLLGTTGGGPTGARPGGN